MGTDGDLEGRVRAALSDTRTIHEIKMFGGIGFMLNGNLLAGASKRGLLLRVGKDRQAEALKRPGARPMEMRGRTMDGYVYVDPPALSDGALKTWLRMAVDFVRTLPPKAHERETREEKRNPEMMRFVLGVLAYVVPTFALGFVWHLVLFERYYQALAIYRPDIIIPFGFLSMLIQAIVFAWIYDTSFARRAGGSGHARSPTARWAPYCRGASRRSPSRRRTSWRRFPTIF